MSGIPETAPNYLWVLFSILGLGPLSDIKFSKKGPNRVCKIFCEVLISLSGFVVEENRSCLSQLKIGSTPFSQRAWFMPSFFSFSLNIPMVKCQFLLTYEFPFLFYQYIYLSEYISIKICFCKTHFRVWPHQKIRVLWNLF